MLLFSPVARAWNHLSKRGMRLSGLSRQEQCLILFLATQPRGLLEFGVWEANATLITLSPMSSDRLKSRLTAFRCANLEDQPTPHESVVLYMRATVYPGLVGRTRRPLYYLRCKRYAHYMQG